MMPDRHDAPSDDHIELLRRRDEILQVMFWMRGEGLADVVDAAALRVFLDATRAAHLERDLAGMVETGLIEVVDPADAGARATAGTAITPPAPAYRLTQHGREEGGRRFADEFADFVRAGHGACADPDCDCHALGPEACAHA